MKNEKLFLTDICEQFAKNGKIVCNKEKQRFELGCNKQAFLTQIQTYFNIPGIVTVGTIYKPDHILEYNGNNALDFLDKLLEKLNHNQVNHYSTIYKLKVGYEKLSSYLPSKKQIFKFQWSKTNEKGIAPFKERASDSGYDLTLVEKIKEFGNVQLFETYINVMPDFGWYFIMVPRSSIIKKGYLLANSIGIIDRTYIGSIKVALIKSDPNAKDLELPNRIIQIIPQQIINMKPIQAISLDNTSRNDYGFGSTG